jgi:penicillin-binding protein 2
MMSLLESVAHAAECGFVQKQINPTSLGMARYLNDDRIGKDGLESSYEQELRGQLGMEAILVNALNQPVRAPEVVQAARDGYNLILTVDVGFQRQVEQILQNWIAVGEQRRLQQSGAFAYKRDYKPIRSGVAIVLEVRTGRVLAMVSWPAYDNNIWDPANAAEWQRFFQPSDPKELQEVARLAPVLNHAIAGQYPPGSTLKQFDAALALQMGVITPETKVRDPGQLLLEDQYVAGRIYRFPNSTPRDNGEITVSEALMRSSNVFFMSVMGGNKEQVVNLSPDEQNIEGGLGITRFAEGLNMFGFSQPTGIRLAGELKGRVPTPKWTQEALLQAWTTGDTYNAAIGQGHLEVTPLQLVTAAAAVANSGDLYQPQIVQAISNSNGEVLQEIQPNLVRHIDIDPGYFAVVREGMRRSVTEGANVAARDDCSGLSIAGKTGTAEFGPVIQIPGANGTIREVRQSHSWFVGFAPYENPQIEVLALVEGTGDLGDGSATIAVPAVTQIMQAYFKVAPPNPLPRGCQTDMPPLPSQVAQVAPSGTYVRSGSGR